jgi:predicted acyltransferase
VTAAPRSLALDALRGGAVALMILVNNPGSWQHLFAPQLREVDGRSVARHVV